MDKNGKAIFYIEKRGEIEMQENQNNQNQEVELDENHLIQIRKDKLRAIVKKRTSFFLLHFFIKIPPK